MSNETTITVTGNLVDDPELRFTPTAGQAVARFRIASTPRYRDSATGEWKDGDTLFLTCQVWRQAAENVAESLPEGDEGDRHGAPSPALLRDQGRREADRLRAPRPSPAHRSATPPPRSPRATRTGNGQPADATAPPATATSRRSDAPG